MIVTLSPDNSSQPFIRPSVYLLPITDINFIVCYCNSSDRNAVCVSSSVLSHCSIKHDDNHVFRRRAAVIYCTRERWPTGNSQLRVAKHNRQWSNKLLVAGGSSRAHEHVHLTRLWRVSRRKPSTMKLNFDHHQQQQQQQSLRHRHGAVVVAQRR